MLLGRIVPRKPLLVLLETDGEENNYLSK